MTEQTEQQLLRLSVLLQLEQRARRAVGAELFFLMVNDTATVVSYQQAALWRGDDRDAGRLIALSGVAQVEDGAPYVRWLKAVTAVVGRSADGAVLHLVERESLPSPLAAEWSEWFPPHALWCPLVHAPTGLAGGLLLGRAAPWGEGERQILDHLRETYSQCWALGESGQRRRTIHRFDGLRRRPGRLALAGGLVLAGLAFVPVPRTILAPAEVVPQDPALVRAPFEGVVDAVKVAPNAEVHAGDVLVTLDTSQLRSRNQVAAKALEMAEADYGQASQQALSDPKAKGRLTILESKVEQQQAELDYVRDLLARAEVTAPIDGIAVFDDPTDWIGRPVSVGERIMLVASPRQVELEIQVPVAEVATFDTGSKVLFFRNTAPDQPVEGKVTFASYASAPTAEGVLSYRFRAGFNATDPAELRLGLKGTAKIYGKPRSLALWLLRRPLSVVRQWLAL